MDLNTLKEYLNIHLISLTQDLEELGNYHGEEETFDWHYITGQINVTNHILELINE
jgi:hypothetical protein